MTVITPAEGTFKRSEVLRAAEHFRPKKRGRGFMWAGGVLAFVGVFWWVI